MKDRPIHFISEPPGWKGGGKNVKDIAYTINGNNCHICISHKSSHKNKITPVIKRHGKVTLLYKYIYLLETGTTIPPDSKITHTCNNLTCINPDHFKVIPI